MGAWTINSLTRPVVTRGTVTGTPQPIADPRPGQENGGSNPYSNLMGQIFGANWQSLMGGGDRSGGGSTGPTAEQTYANSAANLMNTKSWAIGQAYNPWVLNRLTDAGNSLTGGGTGMGMNSGQTSQYNSLHEQLARQMDLQTQWQKTAQAIGSAPVQALQPSRSSTTSYLSPPSGWGSPGTGFGFGR